MQALAITPVTPPASTPSATASPSGGNGFSKALDDAASRRADEQAAASTTTSSGAKEAASPTDEVDDAAKASTADAATDADSPGEAMHAVDPSLWAQIPLRPEAGAARTVPTQATDDGAAALAPDSLAADVADSSEARLIGAAARPAPAAADTATRADPARGSGPVPADMIATEAIPIARDGGLPAATTLSTGPAPLPGLLGLPSLPGLPASTAPMATTATTPGASAGTALLEAHVPVPLGHPGFGAAFGSQLSLLARDGVKQARLHLNPAELGPVQVQITVTGQIARVDLVAEQALTRQVLEQSMPSLASSLRESGLTLAGGGVFEQPRQADPEARDPQARAGRGGANAEAELAAGPAERMATTGRPRGVVDLYA